MTRTHAATRLLEHGPLAFAEFLAITGWGRPLACKTLDKLVRRGAVQFTEQIGCRRRVYQLAGGARA